MTSDAKQPAAVLPASERLSDETLEAMAELVDRLPADFQLGDTTAATSKQVTATFLFPRQGPFEQHDQLRAVLEAGMCFRSLLANLRAERADRAGATP